LRICDRCGAKIKEENGKKDFLKNLKSWAERVLSSMILGEIDLCPKCSEEFAKVFFPKIQKLNEEVRNWVKRGGEVVGEKSG